MGLQANLARVVAELAMMQGETAVADSCSTQAVALYRTVDDVHGLGAALCTRAFNRFEAGHLEVARAAVDEAIALLYACDDQFHLSYALGTLARILAAQGEYGKAYQTLQASTASARAAGAPLVLSMALLGSAFVDVQRGEHECARQQLNEAIMLFQSAHNHHMERVARGLLADIARLRGEFGDAKILYHQVIVGRRERGQLGALARCIECLAFTAQAEGNDTRAIRLLSCLVPQCDGVEYANLPLPEALWDSYYTAAPARQRRCVEQYNIVKRA